MRLATVRTSGGTRAVRIDEDAAVDLGHADLGDLLARYLTDGAVLTTRIAGVGECRNVCRGEKVPA
ncbi:MAG: hypothetical protein QOG20_6410 [Pseudonocardiales bacterium]|nr:hypothetical protein [Pseudonocardiales bacterium]